MKDLYSNIKVTQVLDPDTVTSDKNCASVDMKNYDSVVFLANIGASGDSLSGSVKIELEVEESANDSDFTDVADADLIHSVDGTNDGCFGVIDSGTEDDAVYITGYKGAKRYVRVVVNMVGSHSSGTPISVTAVQSGAVIRPINT